MNDVHQAVPLVSENGTRRGRSRLSPRRQGHRGCRRGGAGTHARRAVSDAAMSSPRSCTCSCCMTGTLAPGSPACSARPRHGEDAITLQRPDRWRRNTHSHPRLLKHCPLLVSEIVLDTLHATRRRSRSPHSTVGPAPTAATVGRRCRGPWPTVVTPGPPCWRAPRISTLLFREARRLCELVPTQSVHSMSSLTASAGPTPTGSQPYGRTRRRVWIRSSRWQQRLAKRRGSRSERR